MPSPPFLSDGQGERADSLADLTNAPYLKKAGPGAGATSGSVSVAPHAVSTHADGYGVLPGDGVVLSEAVYLQTTTLSAAITSTSATSIAITSFAGFPPVSAAGSADPATFRLTIDSEDLLVTSGQGTLTWTVVRGYNGTTAATHLISAVVSGYVAHYILVDASGHLLIAATPVAGGTVGAGAAGAATTGFPVLVAGTDGANTRTLLTDTTGGQIVTTHADGSGVLPGDRIVLAEAVYLPTTTLTAAITAVGSVSIAITSFVSFPPAGSFRITIDSEDMLVTAGNGTTTWTVTRGYNGTTAATHLISAVVTGYVAHYSLVDEAGRQVVAGDAGTDVSDSSTGGASVLTATLAAAALVTTYIDGFAVTGLGATVGSGITITVSDGTWTLNYVMGVPAGVLLGVPALIVEFTRPIPASAVNTAITVTVPSFGTGNSLAAVAAHGHQL